jgi:hypothetical protein
MHLLVIILLIVAAFFFIVAAVVSYPQGKPSARYYPLWIALGLLAWVLFFLIPRVVSG